MNIKFISTGRASEVPELWLFTPKTKPVDRLGVCEVGFFSANIKDIVQAKIGDTVTTEK